MTRRLPFEAVERLRAAHEVDEWPGDMPPSLEQLRDGARGRRGNYSETELRELAPRVAELAGDGYVYFNNDWEGYALENARYLRRRLGG